MGSNSSKLEKDEPLRLCRERKRFIKQAIDSRYDFAAAHVSYVASLKSIGIGLRRYAEAEILVGPPCTAVEGDKTPPSQSSYHPSPSPPINVEVLEGSRTVNYMRSGGGVAVSMRFSPAMSGFMDEEQMGFSLPPPPPPLPEDGGSWDYFDTTGVENVERMRAWMPDGNGDDERKLVAGEDDEHDVVAMKPVAEPLGIVEHSTAVNHISENKARAEERVSVESGDKVEEDMAGEREDPSEFITHRAKDFLSSIKYIEHRFFRASEAGREVSRLLESNKIRVGYSDAKGSSGSGVLATIGVVCCRRTSLVSNEPSQARIITWKRSTSSRSSSSKNPLTTGSKDENDDSGSEFGEEFCMFAGSHSSTLERLYAWERKLYDEVKASEIIMKQYDKKCHQLTRQFAKDVRSQVIDKTRAAIKDLHSQIRVALHACNSISKRIEKMRDDELLPQLVELVQGLARMWKAMLECHHAQYITISLAYHTKGAATTPQNDRHREVLTQLRDEVECFGLSFTNWINSHTSYVESLNGYLQNCIMLPQERSKSRRVFSPRRVLAPPIFVLIRDWSVGVQSLPSTELSDAIKLFLIELELVMGQQEKEQHKKLKVSETSNADEENEDRKEIHNNITVPNSNLNFIQTGLTKVLDKLTKFSEASLKMCDEVCKKSEAAKTAYSNFRQVRV